MFSPGQESTALTKCGRGDKPDWRTKIPGTGHRLSGAIASCDDVGNDPVFQFLKAILQRQLFLFHALNLQRIAAGRDHCIDSSVKIGVFLPQACELQANFCLILLRRVHGWL